MRWRRRIRRSVHDGTPSLYLSWLFLSSRVDDPSLTGRFLFVRSFSQLRGTIGKGVAALDKANQLEAKNAALLVDLNQTKLELSQMETLLASGTGSGEGSLNGGVAAGAGEKTAGVNVKEEAKDGWMGGGREQKEDQKDLELRELRAEVSRLFVLFRRVVAFRLSSFLSLVLFTLPFPLSLCNVFTLILSLLPSILFFSLARRSPVSKPPRSRTRKRRPL